MIQPPNLSRVTFTIETHELPRINGETWVFAYGSLMWNPGFSYSTALPARIFGYHRSLCLWSIQYRGTIDSPGLVLGLDHGGSCTGIGFHVHNTDVEEAFEYLRKRELNTSAYQPLIKRMHLADGRWVDAITFVIRKHHPQHAPPMPAQHAAAIIDQAHGDNGHNRDYLINTVAHLQQHDIHDAGLHQVRELLQ